MIVVKIELWSAITKQVTEIGRMYISNDGTSQDLKRGNYNVAVCKKGQFDKPSAFARCGKVLDYPRQSYNVWRLILRALRSTFPEEK